MDMERIENQDTSHNSIQDRSDTPAEASNSRVMSQSNDTLNNNQRSSSAVASIVNERNRVGP